VPGEPLPFVPKLADLGLARLHGTGPAGTLLTRAGMLLGTPETMAPEQIDDPGACDHRADLYGIGCVLFHMLAGRPAFAGTVSQILAAKAVQARPDLPALPDVPEPVMALLRDMLARDPAERPPGYAELIARLEQLQPGPPSSRGPRLRIAVAAMIVFLVAIVLLVRQFAPSQQPQASSGPTPPPLGEGSVRSLFVRSEHPLDSLAGWRTTTDSDWILDDQVPKDVTGALLTCKQGRSEATCPLPGGSWELAGSIEPRPQFISESSSTNFERAGLRIELTDGHGISLELRPVENTARAPGEAVDFRSRLLRLQRSADGSWSEQVECGAEQAAWGRGNPLTVRFVWHDRALECHWGSQTLRLRAADRGGGEPSALSLYVVKGNVCFADFALRGR